MLATNNADAQSQELYNFSGGADTYYPATYEDAEGHADVFVVFTPSFSIHITNRNGAIICKDLIIYRLDTSSRLMIIVYTSENSFFTLSFSDERSCSTCKDKLIFCHLSASTDIDAPGNLVIPHRSTSTLCKTEIADHSGSHLDSPTVTSIEVHATNLDDAGRVFSSEILCLYMHTSVFDESFTHVFKLFYDEFLLKSNLITPLIVSPVKEDLLDRTLTNLSAYALYPAHTQLHTNDLIGLLSVVNAFILHNVTLSYELLSHDIRVTDPPGAHLRGRTPKDSFSIEKTAYPYHSIRYLDILQQILNHRVISFSSTHQRVILSDGRLVESTITSLILYFDGVCSFIGIFFGAPALAPLKRFFSTSGNVEINAILNTSLYLQLQEILESLFVVLSGCLPRVIPECLLEFNPLHAVPTFNYQSVKKYLLKHLHDSDRINQSCISHNRAIEAIVYAHKDCMARKDIIYNLLYLSFTILDTFNQAAALDESIPQLAIPSFSEKDTCFLFNGLVCELDASAITLLLSLGLKESSNDSLVKELLFGDLSLLLSTNSVDLDNVQNSGKKHTDISIDTLVYRASKRFWASVQPLIMLLRTLTSIFKSSSAFLFEFNSDLCLHFMNCVILIFMDEHFDLLHQNIAAEIEHCLLAGQKGPHSFGNSSRIHAFLAMEMLLRDFIQRINHALIDLLETFTSISLSASSSTVSPLHRSCYKSALLGSIYLSKRIVQFSRPVVAPSFSDSFITYTDTCISSVVDILKQLTDTEVSIPLDLSVYLMLTQHLSDFLGDTIECSSTVINAKTAVTSTLITFIARCIPQIPDRLNESDRDSLISLSLGLEIISTLNIKSLFTYVSQKEPSTQSILQEVIACCSEQARLLSLFIAKISIVIEASRQYTRPLFSLPVDNEASMTVNMLDPGCNGVYDQQQLKEIVCLHIQSLLFNILSLYDHLQVQDFIDSFLAVSNDSITYSSEMANKIKQTNAMTNYNPEIFNGAIDSAACIARCLVNDALPLLDREDSLFMDVVDTLPRTILGFLLLSLYKQLAIARTAADFYRPSGLFTTYLSFAKLDCPTTLFSPVEYRVIFVAVDAQSIIYRTLNRNVEVLKETIAAYTVLSTIAAQLRTSDILANNDEVSTLTASSRIPRLTTISYTERYNNRFNTINKIPKRLILTYLDSLSATFSYMARQESTSVDAQVLILSTIQSLLECIAPTSLLQSEGIKFDELVDLRDYLESSHEAYSEALLDEARNLFKNEIVLSYICKESDNGKCNHLLLSTLSAAIASTDEQLKKLGISLLYQCLIVIALKGVPGMEFFAFIFSPDMCAHLLSIFTPDTPDTLLNPVLGVFDIGLQFLYEVENIPAQKRRGLTSLAQYQSSYSKVIDTLVALISKAHLSITESSYLRLFPFLTNFMVLFNRLNLFKEFSTSFNGLINILIETAMPDYQQILGTHDPLPLLFAMANTLYTYLCVCMQEETFAERPHNVSKSKGTRRPPVTARDINHLTLSAPNDESSSERVGMVVITICTLLLNCFQTISEAMAEANDISFKKAISILYNLSQFGFAGSDCVHILLYTYVGTVSHVGLLQMSDKEKEYDLQIKCIVRIFKAISNVVKNPLHSVFIGEGLTNVLLGNGNDFLVFICVCLAISVRNATLYKSLVQPYESLVKEGGDNPAVPRWFSIFRLIKRARNLADPVDSLVGTSLDLLHCVFNHLVHKPVEQISMFTIGPGRYLLPLLLHCFIDNFEINDSETLASHTDAHPQAELSSQRPNKNHAQIAAEVLAMSMRVAPVQASSILMSKNTMCILISSFEKLVSVFLGSELWGDKQGLVDQPDQKLESITMIAGALGELLSIYADMALLRECSGQFRESDNYLLVFIADLLQRLAQRYKTHSASNQANSVLIALHAKIERCMTLAVLTLRNVVVTAEDLSYITMNIRGTKAYVLIGGVYEYITLHNTNMGADIAGLPAAIEYLTVIIMHLISQAEEAGTDHHAIALVKKYALQLEQNMQSALRKDIYVEECTALLGALNMLP